MLAGLADSDTALAHARELLDVAAGGPGRPLSRDATRPASVAVRDPPGPFGTMAPVMKSSVQPTPRRRTSPASSGPLGSTAVPATCCPGCGPATSLSSTTSTSTAPPPRRSSTRRRRGGQRRPDHLRALPEPRPAGPRRRRRAGRRRHRRRRTGRGRRRRAPSGCTTARCTSATSWSPAAASSTRTPSPPSWIRPARGWPPSSSVHAQQHRVPAPRAGPAAARRGVPRLSTRIEGRPVVVVARGHDHEAELAAIRPFIREQHPVLVGVGAGADAAPRGRRSRPTWSWSTRRRGRRPARGQDAARGPRRRGPDRPRRAPRRLEQLERLGVRPLRFESAATPEDAALLLADAAHADGHRRGRDARHVPRRVPRPAARRRWPAPT